MKPWMLFCFGTVLCWGAYGPVLHTGTHGFGSSGTTDPKLNGFRAMLCVGAAYCIVAVLVPVITLSLKGQLGGFNFKGTTFSTIGGVLGALGATCIVMSFRSGGSPITVMALVFGLAPVLNAIISIASHPPKDFFAEIKWQFILGTVLAGVAAYLIMAFKPKG